MLSRRSFLALTAGAALTAPGLAASSKMTAKERVDRVLKGQDTGRPPFTFWHHFGLEKLPGARHAQATLDFHRKFGTDIVKVMSDYPYPAPAGKWYETKVLANPFPEQLEALQLIKDGLNGEAYFVETVFNPWNQATKISSKEEVLRLMNEDPKALLEALEAIAESEANHAKKAIATGAAGIFLAIDNAQEGILTREQYAKFSEPFDKLILERVSGALLNTLHLHGDKVYVDRFLGKGWAAGAINYSDTGTGVSIAELRKRYAGIIMSGIDFVNYRKLSEADLKKQYQAAWAAAGKKYVVAPGCSVPNESTDAELARLPKAIGV
jgi:uroporphyrinogen decarboxylase